MKVVITSKTSFNTIELSGVNNIAYASGTYTISANGTTYTYAEDSYIVSIL